MKKIILVTISIIFGGLVLFFIFAPTQNSQGQNTTESKLTAFGEWPELNSCGVLTSKSTALPLDTSEFI